jgi:hypothetical protein
MLTKASPVGDAIALPFVSSRNEKGTSCTNTRFGYVVRKTGGRSRSEHDTACHDVMVTSKSSSWSTAAMNSEASKKRIQRACQQQTWGTNRCEYRQKTPPGTNCAAWCHGVRCREGSQSLWLERKGCCAAPHSTCCTWPGHCRRRSTPLVRPRGLELPTLGCNLERC